MTRQRMNRLPSAGLAVLTLLATAPGASAQTLDARLLPWVGCWEPASNEATGDLLCVRPSTQRSAIDVVRLSGNEIVSRELVWADGGRHETERDGCAGWEVGTFSTDGRRLFLKSEHSCDANARQEGTGVMAISPTTLEWVDVRVVGMNGERTAWVQRYTPASAEKTEAAGFGDVLERAWAVGQARIAASAPLDVGDVIEATAAVPHEAVEALLAERGDQLDLTAEKLVRMADAGVPESTIDVAVAVSYPETFQVAASGSAERVATALDDGSLRRRWGYRGAMGPWFYSPYYYDRYGSYFGYGYGYGYGGAYYGGYYGGYRPTVVLVDRQSDDAGHGRVVNGQGYTRSRSGSGSPSRSREPAAERRAGSSTSGAAGSGAPSSSGGSSSTRTAKPRGGGGR